MEEARVRARPRVIALNISMLFIWLIKFIGFFQILIFELEIPPINPVSLLPNFSKRQQEI